MEREIKFRAWSNHYKKFESYSLDQIINGKVNLWFLKESPVIHQFTGLTDKNGKEIYEGDIIKDITNHSSSVRYVIRYDKDKFRGVSNEGDDYGPYGLNLYINDKNPIIEICGNIYETPELLTPTNNP